MVDNEEINSSDFEEMLNKSLADIDSFETGQKIKGKVVYIDRENVFLDISGKSEAIIDISEFTGKDGNISVEKGEIITAYVVSTEGGEIGLTTAIGKSRISMRLLETAYSGSIPVYGTVRKQVKGGFSVSVSDYRCFCPLSQIDRKTPSQPEKYLNKSFDFKIIQLEKNGKNIVLSRSAILKEEKKRAINEMKNSIKPGDIITGKIISIRDFGLFVDIGGIDALVPKSEISRSRFAEINSFRENQEITAKVLSLNWDDEKITLSMKQLEPEPWTNIDRFHIGNNYNARITGIIKQGAFAELEPGLEGFIHISGMSKIKRINNPGEVLAAGDTVNVKIINIDPENRKISLELITGEADPWQTPVDELKNNLADSSTLGAQFKDKFMELQNKINRAEND